MMSMCPFGFQLSNQRLAGPLYLLLKVLNLSTLLLLMNFFYLCTTRYSVAPLNLLYPHFFQGTICLYRSYVSIRKVVPTKIMLYYHIITYILPKPKHVLATSLLSTDNITSMRHQKCWKVLHEGTLFVSWCLYSLREKKQQ